jgi:hypothetical protein
MRTCSAVIVRSLCFSSVVPACSLRYGAVHFIYDILWLGSG